MDMRLLLSTMSVSVSVVVVVEYQRADGYVDEPRGHGLMDDIEHLLSHYWVCLYLYLYL